MYLEGFMDYLEGFYLKLKFLESHNCIHELLYSCLYLQILVLLNASKLPDLSSWVGGGGKGP